MEFDYGYSSSASEQVASCERTKEAGMGERKTVTKTGVHHISITAKLKYGIVAALLVFGCGSGISPSASAYSS